MITLYDYLPSQNGYKVRLLLSHLKQDYLIKEVQIFAGAGHKAAFLDKNVVGAVPVLELEDGRTLPESNAILLFLGEGSQYLPADPWDRAQVCRWMFFEEDYIQNGIATLRYWTMTGKLERRGSELIAAKRTLSAKTLQILEVWLGGHEFLTEHGYSVADISVFAYVSRADEAGLSLTDYPALVRWIDRVKAQDGFLDCVYPYSIDSNSALELA